MSLKFRLFILKFLTALSVFAEPLHTYEFENGAQIVSDSGGVYYLSPNQKKSYLIAKGQVGTLPITWQQARAGLALSEMGVHVAMGQTAVVQMKKLNDKNVFRTLVVDQNGKIVIEWNKDKEVTAFKATDMKDYTVFKVDRRGGSYMTYARNKKTGVVLAIRPPVPNRVVDFRRYTFLPEDVSSQKNGKLVINHYTYPSKLFEVGSVSIDMQEEHEVLPPDFHLSRATWDQALGEKAFQNRSFERSDLPVYDAKKAFDKSISCALALSNSIRD